MLCSLLPVQKKKKSEDAFDDDAFGGFEEEELFATTPDTKQSNLTSSSAPTPLSQSSPSLSTGVVDRDVRFASELASFSKFCGKLPASKDEPRKRALVQLVTFANNKAHLDDLVEAISGWREAKRSIDTQTSDEILGRCVNLNQPQVALSLLANRPKYGVDLTSSSIAHKLLHSLCRRAEAQSSLDSNDVEALSTVTSSAVNDVLLLVALYPQYRLPEVHEDPISLAMVLALFKSLPGEEVRQVEREILEVAGQRRASTAPVKVALAAKEKVWVDKGRPLVPYPVIWA